MKEDTQQKTFICENCGKEHDGSYGSGRFCSKSCRCSFNAKKQKKFPTKEELKLRKGFGAGFGAKSKADGWKCDKCGLVFRTRAELRQHCKDVKHPNNQGWNKGLTKHTNKSVQKSANTLKSRFKSGELVPAFKGKHHSKETKLY